MTKNLPDKERLRIIADKLGDRESADFQEGSMGFIVRFITSSDPAGDYQITAGSIFRPEQPLMFRVHPKSGKIKFAWTFDARGEFVPMLDPGTSPDRRDEIEAEIDEKMLRFAEAKERPFHSGETNLFQLPQSLLPTTGWRR